MHSLIYQSKVHMVLTEEDLELLVGSAVAYNERYGITGFLSLRTNVFVQYLEGEEEAILSLMEKIRKDPRHEILNEFHLGKQKDRLFPSWSMRYISKYEQNDIGLENIICIYLNPTLIRSFGYDWTRNKLKKALLLVKQFL